MLLEKLNSKNNFTAAEAEHIRGKAIDEYSQKEWDHMLDKVDNVTKIYKQDLKRRKEEALKKQDRQKEKEQKRFYKELNERYEFKRERILGDTLQSMEFQEKKDNVVVKKVTEEKLDIESKDIAEEAVKKITENRGGFPYSALADAAGQIEYNGVVFTGDARKNSLCLGDMTEFGNILNIPLADGGCLKVNYDNLEELSKAISMFSPEDVNHIMRAIARHNKIRQIEQQVEDETSGLSVLKKPADREYQA